MKEKHFSDFEDIKSSVGKTILTDISVHDFKTCFEQWRTRWEHCKRIAGR
jgi:hypothetical protein